MFEAEVRINMNAGILKNLSTKQPKPMKVVESVCFRLRRIEQY